MIILVLSLALYKPADNDQCYKAYNRETYEPYISSDDSEYEGQNNDEK